MKTEKTVPIKSQKCTHVYEGFLPSSTGKPREVEIGVAFMLSKFDDAFETKYSCDPKFYANYNFRYIIWIY